jgi:hypothetical protein
MAEVVDIVEAFKDAKRRNPPRPYEIPLGMPERFRAAIDAVGDLSDEDALEFFRSFMFPRIQNIFAGYGEKLVIRRVPIPQSNSPQGKPATR